MKRVNLFKIILLMGLVLNACTKKDISDVPSTTPDEISTTPDEISTTPNAIHWGVNIHDGGSDVQNMANKIADRNLKFVRMDLWGGTSAGLDKFISAAKIMKEKNIKVQTVVFSPFSKGQPRNEDYGADLKEVEQTVYDRTKLQINSTKDWVMEYELQNEIPLYPNMNIQGSTGQNPSDYDTPGGRLQAAVLRGMSRAIDDVRKSSDLPLRIILGTVDRRFGFLTFMQQQGVLFDVVGYHIYPSESDPPLDQDPWYGFGGPLGQLAKFKKPIHINEFNCREIGSGSDRQPGTPNYENQAGQPVTEAGFRSLYKHMNEIVNQKAANIEAVYFYEITDEPHKEIPENRFGLYYDYSLEKPKISLYLATAFSGGILSQAEKDSLIKRNFVYNVVSFSTN